MAHPLKKATGTHALAPETTFSVVLATYETWLIDKVSDREVTMTGYKLSCKYRPENEQGRGVVVYIEDMLLVSSKLSIPIIPGIDAASVLVGPKPHHISIFCINQPLVNFTGSNKLLLKRFSS